MDILGGHVDIVNILLAVIGFFLIRTLNKIDKNQGLLFEKINNLETRLNRLLGAHEVNHRASPSRQSEVEVGGPS